MVFFQDQEVALIVWQFEQVEVEEMDGTGALQSGVVLALPELAGIQSAQ